ncbi:Methyltransferase ptaI [Hyphodiscus hymeniophilus]|uniref:Methyltransferase ptaI n=1 Tax=Hyphodiscus hymeniophilus TaxID=353542 RepID=A0A9P7AYT5_9HELO|nr:Methyltransferase ptaI [Hyphodiscus hymeniophilus]
MSSTRTQELETPFTSAVLESDVSFWRSYIAARPSPDESFFQLINKYHQSHGESKTALAHDVGTGPGNIAERLLAYYDHVVGSDLNDQALAAAPALIPPELYQRTTFIKSPAESLASGILPGVIGRGQTDLITVSECIPLLDAPKALEAFHALLRPAGTVAIYFYGRCIFTDGDTTALNAIYDRIATLICTFLLPFKGTPGFPFHVRGAEALVSYLDNIAIPPESWESVERHKWNSYVPLLFNSKDGYDFEFEPVDRRGEGEKTIEVNDPKYWAKEWGVEEVKAYLGSVYPNYKKKAGTRYGEVEELLAQLREALGGGESKKKVTFPVALILATKK